MTLRKLVIGVFLVCLSFTPNAQTRTGKLELASARKFVQAFYDWYAPKAAKEPTLEAVLKKKPSPLSPALAKALREDLDAEAKSNGDLVGLDFDPFLNSQDPSPKYRVSSVKKEGTRYLVTVVSAVPEGSDVASVVAEVMKKNGKWSFTNFRYPEGSDLLKELKSLKAGRAKPADSGDGKLL